MSFEQLEIIQPIHKALTSEGYETPTPIQSEAIPKILEGRDILGSAQTGTGKTAAFAVPILQLLHTEKAHANKNKKIHALILSPTRELALQIGESFSTYGRLTGLNNVVVFGGVPQKPQTDALKKGVDILIATPGRLLDLLDQKLINLSHVQIFVLDEADRMLDMGFIHDINKVIAQLPEKRQNLLFSATIPPEIAKLSEKILHDPVKIDITPDTPTVEAITQGVFYVAKSNKKLLLLHVLKESAAESVIVFTRTKYGAEYVARFLNKAGVQAEAIHSDKVQKARQRVLQAFKNKEIRVLVATDIAARGLDIEQLSMVINYEIPNMPDSYIHRIGRTGRAGLSGVAYSFCDVEEKAYLKDINKSISTPIPEMTNYPYKPDESDPDTPVPILQQPRTGKTHGERHNYTVNRQNNRNRNHKPAPRQNITEAKPAEALPKPAGEKPKFEHPGKNRNARPVHRDRNTNQPASQKDASQGKFTPHKKAQPKTAKPEGTQTERPNTAAEGKKKPFGKPSGQNNTRGTGRKKSEVWSNDASFNNRRPKRTSEKNFNRDEQKGKPAQKPRVISNDYKPVYDKPATPVKPPKREKLSWYERLGFKTKKNRTNDGNH